jgi:hypothetical protein
VNSGYFRCPNQQEEGDNDKNDENNYDEEDATINV